MFNLMKEKELRKRVYFTLFVLAVASALTQIPIYGVNPTYMKSLFEKASVLTFIDSLSGGSLSNISMAGFGITSYITASIVIQLLSVCFPKIEKIRKDGEQGRKLMEKVTCALAIVITVVSGTLLAISFGKNGLFVEYTPMYVIFAILCWLAGSIIIVYLGSRVEQHGIGNGFTLILGFNILSRIPYNIQRYYYTNVEGKSAVLMAAYIGGLAAALFVLYLITVYLQNGVLRIPLKQTKKKASSMNTDGYIPISANIANVLPVIYASSLVTFPSLIVALFGIRAGKTWTEVLSSLNTSNWYNPSHWYHAAGFALYVLLIVAFGFFGSSLTFSSDEIADSMKKNGNIIPGVNPGADTVKFLERRRKVMSVINVVFLLVIAIVPDFVCSLLGITSFTFLGTSLIIIVNMLSDTALRVRAASLHNDRQFHLFGEK